MFAKYLALSAPILALTGCLSSGPANEAQGNARDAVETLATTGGCVGCYMANLDLSGANFPGVNLSGANLSGTNLANANLNGANLTGANLTGANLTGADLRDATLLNATNAQLVGIRTCRTVLPNGGLDNDCL